MKTNAVLPVKLILTFMTGAALGGAVMFFVQSDDESDQAIATTELSTGDEEFSPAAHSRVNPSVSVDQVPPRTAQDATAANTHQPNGLRLPLEYQAFVGAVRPRRPSFSERHAEFATEPRNEPWAFSMEAGISNFLAARAPRVGVVIESIECRSENCEVAGYLVDGTEYIDSSLYDFTSESWWQGSNAVAVHEFEAGDRDLFVLVTFPFEGLPGR